MTIEMRDHSRRKKLYYGRRTFSIVRFALRAHGEPFQLIEEDVVLLRREEFQDHRLELLFGDGPRGDELRVGVLVRDWNTFDDHLDLVG